MIKPKNSDLRSVKSRSIPKQKKEKKKEDKSDEETKA